MQIIKGVPYPLGVTRIKDGLRFAVESNSKKDCGIRLFMKNKELDIPFLEEFRCGKVYYGTIIGIEEEIKSYCFYEKGRTYLDAYAKNVSGNEEWASIKELKEKENLRGILVEKEFDWRGDSILKTPYEASIFYCMHVRGFTKHTSSKVKGKGTFQGIIEKISYLKELGITGIELMPCYERLEMWEDGQNSLPYYNNSYMTAYHKERGNEQKANYWGYQNAYYFAPKASYAYSNDAQTEMKELVKALHKEGIEVILQFYFPKEIQQDFIGEVIKHWVFYYHIDGVHLLGEDISIEAIAKDPYLNEIKIVYKGFDAGKIYGNSIPNYKNLAASQDDFMYTMRRFLKGDEDMLTSFLQAMRENPREYAKLNYITNYYGFTLLDLVSYDRKHNEENGEDNKDGNDYNFSWNCGVEGPTRKKTILNLRMRQAKNAIVFLLLGQGTPFLLSGDEFLNTQNGNNNAYCQDNEIGWLNWNRLKANEEFFHYIKKMIQLRKNYPIAHPTDRIKIIDSSAGGYPEVSYHGKEAWRPAMENYNRHVGILYSGQKEFFHVAFNMHWTQHRFALPKLPSDYEWHLLVDTYQSEAFKNIVKEEGILENQQEVMVTERTIQIFIGVEKKKK